MNYIKLINAFWEIKRSRSDFDPFVVSLYFTLLHLANKQNWGDFSAYREDIIGIAAMSHNSYYKARKILKESGLIEFNDGANKVSKCTFKLVLVSFTGTQRNTPQGHDEVHDKDTIGTQRNTIHNKPINLKTNKLINKDAEINSAALKNNHYEKENISAGNDFHQSNPLDLQEENNFMGNNVENEYADNSAHMEINRSKIISINQPEEKEKKVAPKKEKDEYTAAMKIIYVRKFPEVYYAAKEAAAIKNLSVKLFMAFKMKNNNELPTVEQVENSFQYMLDNLPQWMLEKGFITPCDLNQQFEKIKAELSNNRQNTKTNGRKPNYDFNELIAEVERTTGAKLTYAKDSY